MIGVVLLIHWLRLTRDRIALALTFVLPVVFFSTFALIFGRMGTGPGLAPVTALAVDQDQSEVSRWFITALGAQNMVRVASGSQAAAAGQESSTPARDAAAARIRAGAHDVAVVIPRGFGASFAALHPATTALEILYNPANPAARFVVSGVLQGAVSVAAPAILMQQGMAFLESFANTLTPVQRPVVDALLRHLRGARPWQRFDTLPEVEDERPDPGAMASPSWPETAAQYAELVHVPVTTTDVRGAEGNMVAYYAAGIGVMFVLFAMVGAGGSLLDEQETGTLERLLNANLGMRTLLMGKWLFFAAMAVAQLVVMFVWGAVVFGLDLWTVNRLVGLLVIAVVTASAAAAFGIVLAPLCKSRAQLSGVSTIVILLMSALGGSMAPRFVMPAFMHHVAKFTLNGWAMDGFLKVFWYDNPHASLAQSVLALGPQVAVLTAITCVCLALAYALARRWTTI